jgi:hypothetical protein
MKNPIRFTITLAGAVLFALPNLAMAQSDPGDSQGDQGADIEGTWIVTVDRVLQNTKFSALMSFTAGGVVLAIGTLDRQPPPPPSPQSPLPAYTSAQEGLVGSWKSMGNNTYVATLNFLIFDSANNAVSMFQNNITLQLTDDNKLLKGSGTACTWDIVGGILGAACNTPVPGSITITGTRLIAQGA